MADMVASAGTAPAPHHLTERDDALDSTFESVFLQYNFPPSPSPFLDVNDEASKFQECLGTPNERLPVPELLSPSRATSYRTNTTSETQCEPWTPQDSGLRTTKGGATEHNTIDWPSFDELVSLDVDQSRSNTPQTFSAQSPPVAHIAIEQLPEFVQTSSFDTGTGGSTWTPGAPPIMDGTFAHDATARPIGRIRSMSKRDRQDTGGLQRVPSKRHKQLPGGFPCEKCNEKFDRACDLNKHFKRAHAGDDRKPHPCTHCDTVGQVKRFLYPKDLRRHLKQVHKIITHSVSQTRPADATEHHASPTSPTSPHGATFWTLTKAVQRFKRLRISSPSPTGSDEEEKSIMVSTDERTFFDVDVTGITAADILVDRIFRSLGMADGVTVQGFHARTYKRRGGSVQLGDKLDRVALLSLVGRKADSQGSLKLVVHVGVPIMQLNSAEARMFSHY